MKRETLGSKSWLESPVRKIKEFWSRHYRVGSLFESDISSYIISSTNLNRVDVHSGDLRTCRPRNCDCSLFRDLERMNSSMNLSEF